MGGKGEVFEEGFEADVPVDVVFEDEGAGIIVDDAGDRKHVLAKAIKHGMVSAIDGLDASRSEGEPTRQWH